jgi:maltose O-acetyltransferase
VYGAVIGDNVVVAPKVVFLKDNHRSDDPGRPIGEQGNTDVALPVIEDWAWIGERAIVLPGRRVGKGAIVGAGAVVTRDVEPYSIVGGNPARPIGHRGPDSI